MNIFGLDFAFETVKDMEDCCSGLCQIWKFSKFGHSKTIDNFTFIARQSRGILSKKFLFWNISSFQKLITNSKRDLIS